MIDVAQLCSFLIADHLCAIDASDVREVIRIPSITPMPPRYAPRGVVGLVNLRGQVVTVVDLRRVLGLEPSHSNTHLVLSVAENAISVLVDRIEGVLAVDPSELFPPPPTLSEASREFVRGAYMLDERLLLLLDTRRIAGLEVRS